MPVRDSQRRNQRAYSRRKSRELVYKVAGRRNCFICNSDENVTTHHVDGNINNNTLGNLMSVCVECHRKLHEKPTSNKLDGDTK